MNVLVIGAGPSGMMAAISSAKDKKNNVTILEKNSTCGKKLLITGKGRCNITNAADILKFYDNICHNPKFLYSAFNCFNNKDIIDFLEKQGVKTKVERGKRVFPVSDNAQDVLESFLKKLKELNVKIITNCEVTDVLVKEKRVVGVKTNSGKEYLANKVILATGGITYKITGSTGDGYEIAKNIGHTIIKPVPALVAISCKDESISYCKMAQGLTLKNVAIRLVVGGKIVYSDFGEMLFTHFGVSGPIILSTSSVLLRQKNLEELLKTNKVKLQIDLKPALDRDKLDQRILRDFEEFKNKQFKNSLNKLLPQKLIEPFIKYIKIDPEKKVNSITRQEREKIVNSLKSFELAINGFGKTEEGIVTAGGINTKEINPKTMESKIINGLYFAGEIIDVDALTGGFNLQIAYSTGYLAGKE